MQQGRDAIEVRELRRLTGTVAWLVGMVARMLRVQAGLVAAVDRLERRTRPAGAHARPGPGRPPLRLLRRAGDLSLGMLLFMLVFGIGQGFLPEGPVPPAGADPSTTVGRARTTTTTGQGGLGESGGSPSGPGRVGGRWAGVTTRDRVNDHADAAWAQAPAAEASPTSTTLPAVPSTTLLEAPSTTLPEVTSTTKPCRNPHGCDDD